MYMISCIINMTTEKITTLLSDVSIEGNLIEKDKIILDAKVNGDIQADDIRTHSKSYINGNIKSKNAILGGKLNGNVNSDAIKIRSTAEIEGVLNQKKLSIEEGSTLKIKAETIK
jgi:cytoskeletal protein CcmA (bactofilin family)